MTISETSHGARKFVTARSQLAIFAARRRVPRRPVGASWRRRRRQVGRSAASSHLPSHGRHGPVAVDVRQSAAARRPSGIDLVRPWRQLIASVRLGWRTWSSDSAWRLTGWRTRQRHRRWQLQATCLHITSRKVSTRKHGNCECIATWGCDETQYQIWTQSSNRRRFQCLTLWPWTLRYVLRSALG